MFDAKSEMGFWGDDFRPDDAEPVNASPAPRHMPVAIATTVTRIRRGRRTIKVINKLGVTAIDNAFATTAVRGLDAQDLADECYSGRPDAVEDALIAILDKQIGREQLASRTLATMSTSGTRKRGRWAQGKVRKTSAVTRM